MDGELKPPEMMEKTVARSDVIEDLLTEVLSSPGTQGDSTARPTVLSAKEDNEKTSRNKDSHQTKSEDTFTIDFRNSQLPFDPENHANSALPVYVPCPGKNDLLQHPPTLLPICNKPSAHESTQLYSSTSRSRLKTTSCTDQTLNDACLFCNPLDCLLATLTGCQACTQSLCSYLCGCQPTTLLPLLNLGDYCGSLAVHCCCSWDCNVCSVCLSSTECLDLGMEFSQMVFH